MKLSIQPLVPKFLFLLDLQQIFHYFFLNFRLLEPTLLVPLLVQIGFYIASIRDPFLFFDILAQGLLNKLLV